MKKITLIVGILVLLSLACSLTGNPAPAEPTSPDANADAPGPPEGGRCGDDVCDGPENTQNCPLDCAAGNPPVVQNDTEEDTTSEEPSAEQESQESAQGQGDTTEIGYRYISFSGTISAEVDEAGVSEGGTWDLFDYTGEYSIELWFPMEGGQAVQQRNTIVLTSYTNRHFGSNTCMPCTWTLFEGAYEPVSFELDATLSLNGIMQNDETMDELYYQLPSLPGVTLQGQVVCSCPPGTPQDYQDPTAYPTLLGYFLEGLVKPVKLNKLVTNSWPGYPMPPMYLISIMDETLSYTIVPDLETP